MQSRRCGEPAGFDIHDLQPDCRLVLSDQPSNESTADAVVFAIGFTPPDFNRQRQLLAVFGGQLDDEVRVADLLRMLQANSVSGNIPSSGRKGFAEQSIVVIN